MADRSPSNIGTTNRDESRAPSSYSSDTGHFRQGVQTGNSVRTGHPGRPRKPVHERSSTEQAMLLYRTHFPAFVPMAFRLAFPNAIFEPAWHIELLCDRVMGIVNRQKTRLLVNMPPRYLKTFVCSVCLPIFWLAQRPDAKILLVVRSHDLGRELSGRIMDIMTSGRFRALFPHVKARSDNPYTITTAHRGNISIVLAGAPIAGKGVDLAIVDYPISPIDGSDKARTRTMNEWFDGEVMPRFNEKSQGAIVVATVRTALTGDLSHHL